ncbi:MAG: M3 family oligoendopeptidase [Armatimonadetes bacterium]|nr:M3 family oligoendopeptidase [Armatimonadota bacterium]
MKSFRCRLFGAAVLAFGVCAVGWAHAGHEEFQPIPEAVKSKYKFNLQRNFFKDEKAFNTALKDSDALIARIETLKGKVTSSPRNLYNAISWMDEFSVKFNRVYWYLQLKYSTNTKDLASRDRCVEIVQKIGPKLTFVNDEIKKMTPAKLASFVKAYPPLGKYRYAVEDSMRGRPHTLGLSEEELLARTGPLMGQWQDDLYNLLMDRTEWGTVNDPKEGPLDVRQDAGRIGNSLYREVRKEGYEKNNAAYKAQRDLFAFDFINVARTNNELAKIRKFINGQDAAYFNLHLSYPAVEAAFGQILGNGALSKRYQTLRKNRVQAFTGFDPVYAYDMSLTPPDVEKPRFTIQEATKVILDSVKYLGPEYHSAMDRLLDPANGRLDLVGGPNRVPGGFAIPSPGHESVFYSYAYEGYFGDVSTLAHEGGHVVQDAVMQAAGVAPVYSDGPRYLTESFAILNELVLADHLYRKSTNPGIKQYYLEKLTDQMFGFYGTARVAQIEKSVYESVSRGTVKTADDLDAVAQKIGSKSSIWYDLDPSVKALWQEIEHFYTSPTYMVNYVFADLLAQRFFAMYKADPNGFAKRYLGLLKAGYTAPPDKLLMKHMGINIKDPAGYTAVFRLQEQYLAELEKSYSGTK